MARIYPITKEIKKKIESLIYGFLWNPNTIEQIKRKSLQCSISQGGLGAFCIEAIESAALLERLVLLTRKTDQKESDFWIKHARMETGYHIKKVNRKYYINNEKHYMDPCGTYKKIIQSLKRIPGNFDWTNSSFGCLRSTLTPKQEDSYKKESKNLNILNSAKHFDNRERETAMRIINKGYLWGEWRERVGLTSTLKNKCNFCKKSPDSLDHIFRNCAAIKPIWENISTLIANYTGINKTLTEVDLQQLEVGENNYNIMVYKIISTTRTEVLRKKEYLDLKNKYANIQSIIPEIMYKIRTKMKIYVHLHEKSKEIQKTNCNCNILDDWLQNSNI